MKTTNDYNAIMNLLHEYAELFDLGDLEKTTALFAKAKVQWAPNAPFMNAEELLQLFRKNLIMHDGVPRTHHLVTNAIINIAEDGMTATARSYYTVIQQTDKLPFQLIAGGRYHDKLKKENGAWIFTSRELLYDLMGDASDHIHMNK